MTYVAMDHFGQRGRISSFIVAEQGEAAVLSRLGLVMGLLAVVAMFFGLMGTAKAADSYRVPPKSYHALEEFPEDPKFSGAFGLFPSARTPPPAPHQMVAVLTAPKAVEDLPPTAVEPLPSQAAKPSVVRKVEDDTPLPDSFYRRKAARERKVELVPAVSFNPFGWLFELFGLSGVQVLETPTPVEAANGGLFAMLKANGDAVAASQGLVKPPATPPEQRKRQKVAASK